VSRLFRPKPLHAALVCACLLVLGSAGSASATDPQTGGAVFVPPPPPPSKAVVVNGKAIVPAGAPRRVRGVITAGNRLIGKPYRYGGGHRAFTSRLDTGYDCSGSVSYALYGGRFLLSPLPSGSLRRWGQSGTGTWITVYAHGGHAYVVVAGLRFDTSLRDPDAPRPLTGPRWSRTLRASAAYTPRHPLGY
jgi:hypothetical protein